MDIEFRYGKQKHPLVDSQDNFTEEYLWFVSKTARNLIAVAAGKLNPYHLKAAKVLLPLFVALSPERQAELIALWKSWGLDLDGGEESLVVEEDGPVIITS